MLSAGFAGCGDSSDSGEHGRLLDTTSEATTQMTVEINTETLAPEQQEQVSALAETLTDKELENKTIKWLSFYDPWHPTGFGNSKPVSVELFEEKYGGEIESDPEIWTKTFGSAEDVFFVPIPRDEQADKYYYNAEIDSCNLCKGAQNPEGVARLMECVIASYNDENAIRISDEKHKNDYGWSDEMVEMKHEVHRLTSENPVRDIYGGLTSDYSALLGDSINKAINGTDWYTTRDSIVDTVNTGLEEINAQIDKLQ